MACCASFRVGEQRQPKGPVTLRATPMPSSHSVVRMMATQCGTWTPSLTVGRRLPPAPQLNRRFKRVDQLDTEQRTSAYLAMIVADYHWLEMAISYQGDVLGKHGRLDPGLVDIPSLAALRFASTVVQAHRQLSPKGRTSLEGRPRDALSAEVGLAPVFLEMELGQRLSEAGHDVTFPDLEGTAQHDIQFGRGVFQCEVECKSLSADAGRQIHRKNFYRFIDSVAPSIEARAMQPGCDVLVVTLVERLSSRTSDQQQIRVDLGTMLSAGPRELVRAAYRMERKRYDECLADAPLNDRRAYYEACQRAFGSNCHAAGMIDPLGECGCLIVMRSDREDDTSLPLLEAMRKAASQLSGKRPSFIAVQFNNVASEDISRLSIMRRTQMLATALFFQYGAAHVNGMPFSGFGGRTNGLSSPLVYSIPNPAACFPVALEDVEPLLGYARGDL